VPSFAFLKSIIDELGNGPIGPRQLPPAPARQLSGVRDRGSMSVRDFPLSKTDQAKKATRT
jgi:hypothetical protein